MAELSIERKIKLSKLDMETSKASSPISTNIIHVILWLLRKGIYLPPEWCLGSCVKGPCTQQDNIPHTAPQSTENHFQGPSSCIIPRNTTNLPPTNKPLSRKQMPTTMQGATKTFQLPQRTCCRQKSLLSCTFQVIWVYCVSKYSRASPGYRKVDLKLHLPTPRGPFFKDVLLRPDYSWGCLFHLLQIPKLFGNLHQRWNYQGFLSRPLTLVRGGQTSGSRFKGKGQNRFPSGVQPTLRVRRATSHPGYRLEKEALTSTPLQPSRPQVPRPSRIPEEPGTAGGMGARKCKAPISRGR